MSNLNPLDNKYHPNNAAIIAGCFIFTVGIAAWLMAELNKVDSSVLWILLGPLLLGLFLGQGINQAKDAAQQAAAQTNGTMDSRIETAVTNTLQKRDTALAMHTLTGGTVTMTTPDFVPTTVKVDSTVTDVATMGGGETPTPGGATRVRPFGLP